jgi:hypothetical protein
MRTSFATCFVASLIATSTVTTIARADAGARQGEAGESCRARSDCSEGLMCVANTCVVRLSSPAASSVAMATPTVSARSFAPAASGTSVAAELPSAWNHPFEDGSTRFFAGITLAPGFSGFISDDPRFSARPTVFAFALRGGVLVGQNAFELEVAPGSYVLSGALGAQKAAIVTASYARYIRVAHNLYWPIRAGFGYFGGLDFDNYFTAGGSLIGLAYTWKHVLFEINAPTVRYTTDFGDYRSYDVQFGLKATYVF